MHLQRSTKKLSNLELKTQPKQLLGFLPITFQLLAKYLRVDDIKMQYKITNVSYFPFLHALMIVHGQT
jgi:hypothetical protein